MIDRIMMVIAGCVLVVLLIAVLYESEYKRTKVEHWKNGKLVETRVVDNYHYDGVVSYGVGDTSYYVVDSNYKIKTYPYWIK